MMTLCFFNFCSVFVWVWTNVAIAMLFSGGPVSDCDVERSNAAEPSDETEGKKLKKILFLIASCYY